MNNIDTNVTSDINDITCGDTAHTHGQMNYVVQIRDAADHGLWRGLVEWTECTKKKVTGVTSPTPDGVRRLRHLKWTVFLASAANFNTLAEAKQVADGLRFTYGDAAVRIIAFQAFMVGRDEESEV